MSTLNVANITDGTDTVETGYVVNGSAKAWVNFNGTGTIAIRNSLNTSSVSDNGIGVYGTNYSSHFNAADYSYQGCCIDLFYGSMVSPYGSISTNGFNFYTHGQNQATYDANTCAVESTGDLA